MPEFTQEQNIQYWKERINDIIVSTQKTAEFNFLRLLLNVNHVSLETKEITQAIEKITQDFAHLQTAVVNAKPITETTPLEQIQPPVPPYRGFKEATNVSEGVSVGIV